VDDAAAAARPQELFQAIQRLRSRNTQLSGVTLSRTTKLSVLWECNCLLAVACYNGLSLSTLKRTLKTRRIGDEHHPAPLWHLCDFCLRSAYHPQFYFRQNGPRKRFKNSTDNQSTKNEQQLRLEDEVSVRKKHTA